MTPGHLQHSNFNNKSVQQTVNSSTGYSYQQPASSVPGYGGSNANAYPTANQTAYGTPTYGSQQYGTYNHDATTQRSGDQASTSTRGNLNVQSSYPHQNRPSASNSFTPNAYSSSSWENGSYEAASYSNSHNQVSDRAQNTSTMPGYAGQASTTGALAEASQRHSTAYQSQGLRPVHPTLTSSTHDNYRTGNIPSTQAKQQQVPQRYSSPSHNLQTQQQQPQQQQKVKHHNYPSVPPPRHIVSPQMSTNQQQPNKRQNSASAEPPAITVNPSQVYDARAEQQRKAQIEASRRRKREEVAAKRKAEEDLIAEQQRTAEEQRNREAVRAEEERQKVREEAAAREQQAATEEDAAKKPIKAALNRKHKAEQWRKASEEKRQSQTAASALQQMALGSTEADARSDSSAQGESEEAQMRAMFARMREFNAKNPNMLAKLWEEERQYANSQSPQPLPATASNAGPSQSSPTAEIQHSQPNPSGPKLGVAYSTPALPPAVRPFQRPRPVSQALPAQDSNIQQLSNARPQISANLWPKQRRPAISEVAVKWLVSLPENAGKMLHATDVLKILDGNPTYSQLCAGLENLGVKFDHSTLARVILRLVPDVATASAYVPDHLRNMAYNNHDRFSNGSSSGSKSQDHGATVNYEAPSFISANATSGTNPGGSLPPGAPALHNQPSSQTRTPSSLKRHDSSSGHPTTSSGFIARPELTQISPETVRPPANKEEAARKRNITDLVDLTTSDSEDEEPPPKKAFLPLGTSPITSVRHLPGNRQPVVANFAPPYGLQSQNAARVGIHIPPQHNVASLGPAIRNQPTPTSLQSTQIKGPTPEQLQQERMKGKMLVEPIMRDRVARKSHYDNRTVARDVLLATGRHPDMKPLNQHLVVMSKLLSDHGAQQEMDGSKGLRSDLATIRWDIIDPEPPTNSEVTSKQANVEKQADLDETEKVQDTCADAHTATEIQHSPSRPLLTVDGRPKKKLGRPRKHDREGTASAAPATSATSAHQTPIITTELNETTTSASSAGMSASGGAVGYAAFRQYDENGNLIKTKGRPKGWKKALHSREALGLDSGAKKSKPPVMKRMAESEPQVYKCEWQGCPAELHNLETLKKHVVKLHDEEDDAGQYACKWKECSLHKPLLDFQTWTEHIYDAHMSPVAWKLGDGPKGGIVDYDPANSESYLSDAHGRSVTPVIMLDDTSVQSTRTSAAEADLKVLIDHKRIVGPSFEKTGCTLANTKRRRGFLDDEDFEHHYEEEDTRF